MDKVFAIYNHQSLRKPSYHPRDVLTQIAQPVP